MQSLRRLAFAGGRKGDDGGILAVRGELSP